MTEGSLRTRLHARLDDTLARVPPPAVAFFAAAAPASILLAALCVSGATDERIEKTPPPPAPSPFVVGLARATTDGCQLAVRVVDAQGRGRDATVHLARVGDEGAQESWQAHTNRHGAVRFIDLAPGAYHTTAVDDALALGAAPAFVCEGSARASFDVALVERQGTALTGTVFGRGDKPVPGAALAFAQDNDSRTSLAGVARVAVDVDGSFTAALSPGRYRVLVTAPGHAPISRTVELSAQTPAQLSLRLAYRPSVSGVVRDASGNPVAGAEVSLGGAFDPKARRVAVTTDEEGRFNVPVMEGQDVTLTAVGQGLNVTKSVGRVGEAGVVVDLTAALGRTVRGVVHTADGRAHAFGAVKYRVRALGLLGTAATDADGAFVIEGLPADADVDVWADGNATGAWGARVASPGSDDLAIVYTPPAY